MMRHPLRPEFYEVMLNPVQCTDMQGSGRYIRKSLKTSEYEFLVCDCDRSLPVFACAAALPVAVQATSLHSMALHFQG